MLDRFRDTDRQQFQPIVIHDIELVTEWETLRVVILAAAKVLLAKARWLRRLSDNQDQENVFTENATTQLTVTSIFSHVAASRLTTSTDVLGDSLKIIPTPTPAYRWARSWGCQWR